MYTLFISLHTPKSLTSCLSSTTGLGLCQFWYNGKAFGLLVLRWPDEIVQSLISSFTSLSKWCYQLYNLIRRLQHPQRWSGSVFFYFWFTKNLIRYKDHYLNSWPPYQRVHIPTISCPSKRRTNDNWLFNTNISLKLSCTLWIPFETRLYAWLFITFSTELLLHFKFEFYFISQLKTRYCAKITHPY